VIEATPLDMIIDIADPDQQGRVKIRLPWAPDPGGGEYNTWARLATLMGGNNRGSWFIPDVDDEVLVAFEGGDPRRPYVVGALWNGSDAPPESMDGAGRNPLKVLRSRNGVKVTLDDSDGREQLVLETPGGQKITLKDGPGAVEIVDSNGNSVKLETSGITVNAAAKVTISASQVEISAGMVTVNAGMSRFSGVVQADTVISNSVVSASYTPGAGNIW
jgi:uncharacterized protein involved in type VI secretion and phage assembly